MNDSIPSPRLVRRGQHRFVSSDSTGPWGFYEIWVEEEGLPWVAIMPDGTETAVRLNRLTVEGINNSLGEYTPGESTIETIGIGLQEGELAISLRQDWPIPAIGAILLTVIGFTAAVAVALRARRRSAHFQALAARDAASTDAERIRVAREIHDGPLQELADLARTQDSGPPNVRDRLREVSAELRALASDLRPPALERVGLIPALEDLASRWGARSDSFKVRIRSELRPGALSPETEAALYRIAQESLTNAQKHGRAQTAWVFLREVSGATELVVRDDGVGIPETVSPRSSGLKRLVGDGHLGLMGMGERARSIGGALSIGNGPGGIGTEVQVRIPSN